MQFIESQSANNLVKLIEELRLNKFEPTELKISFKNFGKNSIVLITNIDNFIADVISKINDPDFDCQIGDFITVDYLRITNKTLSKYSNEFLVYDPINSLDIKNTKIYNKEKNLLIERSINRSQEILLKIFNNYSSFISNIKRLEIEKLYVVPCYVEDGYVLI